MSTGKSLYLGRTAFEKEKWKDALEQLSKADNEEALQPDDLELLAISSYLTGRFHACYDIWTRAHNSFLKRGDIPGAVRCAFWLGFVLMNKGEKVRGGGWIGHAKKLSDEGNVDCVEQGYLFIPVALTCLGKGDIQGSIHAFDQAMKAGNRFHDKNLLTLAHLGHGQALIRLGEVQKGVAFLDEAMIAVESGGLSPMVVGIVYCALIEECLEIFDLSRAKEWTDALSDWCSSHPHLVPFRGQCLTRRSEIMLLQGEWANAISEIHRAIELLSNPTPEPAAGAAFYQLGNLYRLNGDYSKAEHAYNEANKLGRNPQPGFALLRLAQGQIEKSKSSINNAVTETKKLKNKSDALIACIEIMLADENIGKARSTLDELKEIVRGQEAPLLQALISQAEGAVFLAEGRLDLALTHLRNARKIWEELKAPYDAARTRSLMAKTYWEMGDEDSAKMEYEAARSAFKQLNAVPDVSKLDEYFNLKIPCTATGLTQREKQVLQLIAEGKSNKSIADKLFISERTVERHVSNILIKLEVSSRTEAAAHAHKYNLL